MANIIVTGGSGFIGQQVVLRAVKNGHNVGVLDMREPKDAVPGTGFAQCNLASLESVLKAFDNIEGQIGKPDAVIHLAASFNYSMPDNFQNQVNVIGTDNVAKAAVESGTDKFLYMGAIASCREGFAEKIKEDTPLHPFENYGKSKQLGEELLFEDYYRKGLLLVASFRSVMVYGNFATGSYIDGLFNMIKTVPVIIVPINDTCNSYVHTDDLARGFLHAIENPAKVFAKNARHANDLAYNLADDEIVSERNVARLLKSLIPGASKKPIIPLVPQPMLEIAAMATEKLEGILKIRPSLALGIAKHARYNHILDNSKFKATGFEYSVPSVKIGMPMVVDWYKENVWK